MINKELLKYKKILNEQKKLYSEKEKLQNNHITTYELIQLLKEKETPTEQIQEEIQKNNLKVDQYQKNYAKLKEKENVLQIEQNLIYNNIIILFFENYYNLINNILNKYINKAIGEKTKEKIQKEIQEEIQKDNNNLFLNVYFTFGEYSNDILKLYFTLYQTKEDKENYSYNNIQFYYNLNTYYNKEDQEIFGNYFTAGTKDNTILLHNNEIWEKENYNYIKETRETAKRIYKTSKKEIEKVNKLIEQARTTRKNYNEFLNNYKLKTYDYLEIAYNQRL